MPQRKGREAAPQRSTELGATATPIAPQRSTEMSAVATPIAPPRSTDMGAIAPPIALAAPRPTKFAAECMFLMVQLEEQTGRVLDEDDVDTLFDQYEALLAASPSLRPQLRELGAARRTSAPLWGPGLTEREWASVLESIGRTDEDDVNCMLFIRIFFESQLLRARCGGVGSELLRAECGGRRGGSYPGATPSELRYMEVESYACHINAYLGNDPFLKDVLPIHPQNFFDAVKDGVLLCKLINLAVPGTIDERAINSKGSLTPQDKIDNHTLFLMSAMAIGLTSDITVGELAEAGELAERKVGIMLSLFIQLLADVNLIRTPGLLELAENNQDSEKLMRAPPDMLLLKWINHMFRKGGVCRRVSNFSSDMKV
nr:unnamed protein product [Digitaria exilis]